MRFNRKKISVLRMALAGLIATALAGQAKAGGGEVPEVYQMIPLDAPVAIVVPNLSALSQKVAKLNEQALDSMVPNMVDLLGEMKMTMGIEEGLNEEGSLAIALTDAQALNPDMPKGLDADDPQDDKPPMIMLIPVKDYDAFVVGYGGDPAEKVTQLFLPDGSHGYAKKFGGYAVLAPNQQDAQAYQPPPANGLTARVGRIGRRCLASSDAAFLVNIEALAPVFQPQFEEAITQLKAEMDREMSKPQAGMDAEMMVFVRVILEAYFDAAQAVWRDSASCVVGLDLDDQGLGFSGTLQFKANSPSAKVFGTGQGAGPLLSQLPNQDYMMAFSADMRGLHCQPLLDDLVSKFPEDADHQMTGMIKDGLAMWKQSPAMAMAYYPPAGPPMGMMGGMMGGVMGGMMNSVGVIQTEDPQAYLEMYQSMIEKANGLKVAPAPDQDAKAEAGNPQGDGEAPQVSIFATYTPNALEISGVQVNEYQIQYQYPPEVMQQMGPIAPMMAMFGGMGYNGYIAAKGSSVVMTTTRDGQLMQQALASVDQNNGLGTQGQIEQVRQDGLWPHTVMEGYISVNGVMGGVNTFMAMMGQPPIEVPEGLPPMATAVSVEQNGIATRLYVPTEIVRFGSDTVNHLMGMMMGGPNAMPPGEEDWDPPQGDHPNEATGPRQGPPPAPY